MGVGVKPSVCLFTDSLAPSGVGEHMLTLAAELRGRYALSFACPPSPSGVPLLARARKMGLATLPLEVRGEREASERLGGWLRAQRVRVFHGHAGVAWEGHDGVRAARAAAVPSVVRTEHLPDLTIVFRTEDLPDLVHSPYHRADQRPDHRCLTEMVEGDRADYLRMIGMVDRLICVSAAARESFLRSGVAPHKLRVVRNGIRPQPAARGATEVRERSGIPSRARVVLTVGRMLELKGYHCLLEAVPAVVEGEPNACFLWVGEGPLEGELRERARALGLDGRVRFAGRREDVPDLMAAADLFVLPSLVEGLPLVVLEAMAAGLPVVGTRVCGTSEAIRDGVTGRLVEAGGLVEAGDMAALAAAILEPLEDPQLAARWGAAGRSLVEREFSAERMARETAKIYEGVLREPAAARPPVLPG